jgi:hypothetical protein
MLGQRLEIPTAHVTLLVCLLRYTKEITFYYSVRCFLQHFSKDGEVSGLYIHRAIPRHLTFE